MAGGNSDPALRRVAAWADGWYGFNLDGIAAVRASIDKLELLCAKSGRDRAELRLAVALVRPQVRDVAALGELGVDELVLVEAPPDNPDAASAWVAALADQWLSGDLSQRLCRIQVGVGERILLRQRDGDIAPLPCAGAGGD